MDYEAQRRAVIAHCRKTGEHELADVVARWPINAGPKRTPKTVNFARFLWECQAAGVTASMVDDWAPIAERLKINEDDALLILGGKKRYVNDCLAEIEFEAEQNNAAFPSWRQRGTGSADPE